MKYIIQHNAIYYNNINGTFWLIIAVDIYHYFNFQQNHSRREFGSTACGIKNIFVFIFNHSFISYVSRSARVLHYYMVRSVWSTERPSIIRDAVVHLFGTRLFWRFVFESQRQWRWKMPNTLTKIKNLGRAFGTNDHILHNS